MFNYIISKLNLAYQKIKKHRVIFEFIISAIIAIIGVLLFVNCNNQELFDFTWLIAIIGTIFGFILTIISIIYTSSLTIKDRFPKTKDILERFIFCAKLVFLFLILLIILNYIPLGYLDIFNCATKYFLVFITIIFILFRFYYVFDLFAELLKFYNN